MNESGEKQLIVRALKNGTVIDHIPSSCLFKVISILKLENIHTHITFGLNLESKKLGSKGIIKISDKFFEQDDINKIAIIVPDARLNIIKDYKVIEKKIITPPDTIKGITKCFNPKCVTNHEKIVPQFTVVAKSPVVLTCIYCEKNTDQEHFNLL